MPNRSIERSAIEANARALTLRLLLGFLMWLFATVTAPEPARAAPDAPDVRTIRRIDGLVARTMSRLRLHSVSIALVVDDRIGYARAYGRATTATRYEIGSVTKQFTAACILLLARDGKLGLDDRVAAYLPHLEGANRLTIRELLTHTAGLPDYYATTSNPALYRDTTLDAIVARYARARLAFAPGTKWVYSNTGYAVLTQIVERASGMPYARFVATRIFRPLRMIGAIYQSRPAFGVETATGYERVLLAPPTRAKPEGRSWLNGAAGLAMTATDLARWDRALLTHRLLDVRSTEAMFAEQRLTSGARTGYGLGVFVARLGRTTIVSHLGEVQGFTSENALFPEKHFAVAVLCNETNSIAPEFLAEGIAGAFGHVPASPDPPAGSRRIALPLAGVATNDPIALRQAKQLLYDLEHGRVRRASLTSAEATVATSQRLDALERALRRLGPASSFENAERYARGEDTITNVRVLFANDEEIVLNFARNAVGKLDDLLIEAR